MYNVFKTFFCLTLVFFVINVQAAPTKKMKLQHSEQSATTHNSLAAIGKWVLTAGSAAGAATLAVYICNYVFNVRNDSLLEQEYKDDAKVFAMVSALNLPAACWTTWKLGKKSYKSYMKALGAKEVENTENVR